MNRRRQNWWLTLRQDKFRKPVYCLSGGRHKGGGTLIWAFVRNVGTCRPDAKGETQVKIPQE